MTSFPDKTVYADGLYYEPFVADDGRVGYRASLADGSRETFIYLNPSWDGGRDANVFVYEGVENDPALDAPQVFVGPESLWDAAPSAAVSPEPYHDGTTPYSRYEV